MDTTAPPDGSAALRPRGDTTLYLTASGLSAEPPPDPVPVTDEPPADDANDVRADAPDGDAATLSEE